MGAATSMVAGAALVGVPEILDRVSDKLNGDERKTAMKFAKDKLSGLDAGMVTQVSKNVPVVQATPVMPTTPVTPAMQPHTMSWLWQTFGLGKKPKDKPERTMRLG